MPSISNCKFPEGEECTLAISAPPAAYSIILDREKGSIKICIVTSVIRLDSRRTEEPQRSILKYR